MFGRRSLVYLLTVLVLVSIAIYLSTRPRKIKVGVLVSISGRNYITGSRMVGGLEMFKMENPDANLRIVLKDTRGSSDLCVELAEELIRKEKVKVLLGETTSKNTLKLAQIAEKYGIPLLIPRPMTYSFDGYNHVFELAPNITDVSEVISDLVEELTERKEKVMFIRDGNSDYSKKLSNLIRSNLEREGYTVDVFEDVPVDFKDLSDRYSVIVIHRKYSLEMARIIERIRSLGYRGKMIMASTKSRIVRKYLGECMVGLYAIDYTFRFTEEGGRFSKRYFELFGTEPYLDSVLMYDSLGYVDHILRKREKGSLSDVIKRTRYKGVAGYIGDETDRKLLIEPVKITTTGLEPLKTHQKVEE